MMDRKPQTLEEWTKRGEGRFPGFMGIVITMAERDLMRGQIDIQPHHVAPNGFLHAGTVVTLADTCCGYATINNLPEGATGFTTIELKSNFLGTALSGIISCDATPLHRGRTTQVWDGVVSALETGKHIAHFRCTQMILWPKE